jgi:hypothetical protein
LSEGGPGEEEWGLLVAPLRSLRYPPSVGPKDPKYLTRDIARDLSALVGVVAALKGDANHWLEGSEYAALKHRPEHAHARTSPPPGSTRTAA